jgi:5,10-methylenetetrahydromethanopterin reductase
VKANEDGVRPAISLALPPSRKIVDYARLAARLGYRRLFVFDSPALYGDVWVALARVAESVPDIELASGVAVSSLRHPMVTASALASIEELAPGRISAYFGTGFTARMAMGKRSVRWADLATYFRQVRSLLNGETVEIDGAPCQMIHSPGFAPPRPINVTLGLAPVGPKGFQVAQELADSVILAAPPGPDQRQWGNIAILATGTVLDPGEDHRSPRAIESLGPQYATRIHSYFEWAPAMLSTVPGGEDWLARIDAERPPNERHLSVHEGHLVAVTERDAPLIVRAREDLLSSPFTGTVREVAAHLDTVGAAGVTEVAYNPTGPHVARDLEAFAAAAQCVA